MWIMMFRAGKRLCMIYSFDLQLEPDVLTLSRKCYYTHGIIRIFCWFVWK